MNAFRIFPSDQADTNWLMFDEYDESPPLRVKPRYADCYCPKCFKVNHDGVFARGFGPDVKLKGRKHFLLTSEGFLCVHDDVRELIDANGWRGITLKQVPGKAWHVVNLSLRVNADRSAYVFSPQKCEICGRHKFVGGFVQYRREIDVPETYGTFFSSAIDYDGSLNGEREWLVTEDIVACFKGRGIKGAMFAPLFSPEDEERFRKRAELQKRHRQGTISPEK